MREVKGFGRILVEQLAHSARITSYNVCYTKLLRSLNAGGSDLANDIVTVKHGSKRHAWEIDAISGATISSKAVGRALNQSAKRVLPLLAPHLDSLRSERGAAP